MPAYWVLNGYRVEHARLTAFVGGRDEALCAKIVRTSARDLVDDYRLDPPGLAAALSEIASRKLNADHDTAYRIALEAILEKTAKRITGVEGYADRDLVPKALRAVGLKVLAKAWDKGPGPRFPWIRPNQHDVDWPWATFLDRATLDAAITELTRLACEGEEGLRGAAAARSVLWRHPDPKKDRMLVSRADGSYALITDVKGKRLVAVGALDDVLASVPDEDFPAATKAAAAAAATPKGGLPRSICPPFGKARKERLANRLKNTMKLDEYDEEVIEVVFGLIGIVTACDDIADPFAVSEHRAKPKKKKRTKKKAAASAKSKKSEPPSVLANAMPPFVSGTRDDGVMLYVDGEQ